MKTIINSTTAWHKNTQNLSTKRSRHLSGNKLFQKIFLIILKQQMLEHHIFNITPKLHKNDIPGKPVISSTEYHTSKISKFVDHSLQLHAKTLPSYAQATYFILETN